MYEDDDFDVYQEKLCKFSPPVARNKDDDVGVTADGSKVLNGMSLYIVCS